VLTNRALNKLKMKSKKKKQNKIGREYREVSEEEEIL
jgi:hypothetical protein